MYTNNMKKGFGNTTTGHLFGQYGYMGCPYDAEKDADNKNRLEHKAKIFQPFVGSKNPSKTFTPDYVSFQPL